MSADTDPKLAGLFATPMTELSDDEQALNALLARLEAADARAELPDRHRGVILAAAGVAGALLAGGIFVATNAASASVESFSALSMRLSTVFAQAMPEWLQPVSNAPDGSVATALGILALAAAAGITLRRRA